MNEEEAFLTVIQQMNIISDRLFRGLEALARTTKEQELNAAKTVIRATIEKLTEMQDDKELGNGTKSKLRKMIRELNGFLNDVLEKPQIRLTTAQIGAQWGIKRDKIQKYLPVEHQKRLLPKALNTTI